MYYALSDAPSDRISSCLKVKNMLTDRHTVRYLHLHTAKDDPRRGRERGELCVVGGGQLHEPPGVGGAFRDDNLMHRGVESTCIPAWKLPRARPNSPLPLSPQHQVCCSACAVVGREVGFWSRSSDTTALPRSLTWIHVAVRSAQWADESGGLEPRSRASNARSLVLTHAANGGRGLQCGQS